MPDDQGRVRWGVISTAKIGVEKGVIAAGDEADHGVITAISSRDAGKAAEAAAKLGLDKSYGSYQELLDDPDIDAVYNPLPNSMHAEWTIKAAQAGKHILCEKPLAVDAAEARTMVDACDENGVLLMEAFMYRFGNRNLRAREIIKDGGLGQARLVRVGFSFPLPRDPDNVRLQKDLFGGALCDIGSYTISTARYLYDAEPMAVDARLDFDREFEVDIGGLITLDFPGHRRASLDFSFAMSRRQRYEVVGTAAALTIEDCFLPVTEVRTVDIERREGTAGDPGPEHGRAEPFPPMNPYTAEFEAMSKSILTGAPLPWGGEDAVNQMRVMDAVRESHATGRRVGLEPLQEAN
jgi:D-xylose 1-dehydrogenase (NADP+, D-xylono-1,5-lactone-forming)